LIQSKIKGIVIIVGNYGSGKTETAINLAFNRKTAGVDVSIADLDLVNPYFRTREARHSLKKNGINVILPDEKYMHADLPILTPAVSGIIKQPSELTILDAGGDDAGTTVLAALADVLSDAKVNMLQVINPFRPFTENLKGCMKIMQELEKSSKLKVTGLVSNANIIDETTPDDIYKGYNLIQEVSEHSGIKVEFITIPNWLIPEIDIKKFNCPVLPIERRLAPVWSKVKK